MIRFYRDLSVYCLLAFLLGLPAVLLYFDYFKINSEIILFLGCIYMYLIMAILTRISLKRIEKNDELYFECKINEYIENCKKLLKNYENNSNSKCDNAIKTYMKLKVCNGYFLVENDEEAEKIFKNIRIDFKDDIYNQINKVVYYNIVLGRKIKVGNYENFFEMLDQMKDIINNGKFSSAQKMNFMILVQNLKRRQLLEVETTEEKLKEIELFYLNLLEIENIKINKVYYNYLLAKIYLKLGKIEKMNKCIDYVLENGGDTYYVQYVKNLH